MELYDVFSSPFKLNEFRVSYVPIPQVKAESITNDIEGETTKEEIFNLSKMYFDQLILQYKNYTISGEETTESSYRLSVGIHSDDGELNFKHIYSCFYNNIEDRVSWENKYDDNFTIEGTFFVSIDVNAMYFEDYDPNYEDEDDLPIRKTITESECIICYENKPNILFSECIHLCVCNICDSKGRFTKCPICRTKVKNGKIRLT